MNHLHLAGQPETVQRAAIADMIRSEPLLVEVLTQLRGLKLNDWWVVSGVLYNNVWNRLTGRPFMTGVKDIDVFYFDDSDLSYEAEDVVIKKAEPLFAGLAVPVEIRNQARVHLWYNAHFGRPIAPLTSSRNAIDGFAARTHCVAVRLKADGGLEFYAPYGLDDIFSFRLVPNRVNDNRDTYAEKAARAVKTWPELTVVPW